MTAARLACRLIGIVVSCVLSGGCAETPPATRPAGNQPAGNRPSEFDWVSLFDGRTLGKWKPTDFGGQGEVRVEDGCLILPMGATLTGVTWTGEVPRMNYEIELEARRVEGSDFFCGLTFPVNDKHASLILGGWGGSVCGISCLDGYDASDNETTTVRNFEKGRWYHVRMRVSDNRLQAWLDDEKILDVDTTGKRIDVRIEVEQSRPLGIATWQTTGAIRDIRLRMLRPEEIQPKPQTPI